MSRKQDVRIQNAVVSYTNNRLSDDLRQELIYDSIYNLISTNESYIGESERRLA